MVRKKAIAAIAALSWLCCDQASAKEKAIEPIDLEKAAVTPVVEAIRRTTLLDDSLEVVATFRTDGVFRHYEGLSALLGGGFDRTDAFLEAKVNKQTGDVKIAVFYSTFGASDVDGFDTANYEGISGLGESRVETLNGYSYACSLTCKSRQELKFSVEAKALRGISASDAKTWSFRLKGRSGGDTTYSLPKVEIVALWTAIYRYREEKGLPQVP